jgi:hypothetical protein
MPALIGILPAKRARNGGMIGQMQMNRIPDRVGMIFGRCGDLSD